jgi:HK97 family phage prohead protease
MSNYRTLTHPGCNSNTIPTSKTIPNTRTNTMPKKPGASSVKREVRVYASPQKFVLRKNVDGSRSVAGYFATFNTLSHDLGFREKLLPGCFANSLKTQPVQCLFNHRSDALLGRTESSTLQVSEDSKGLRFKVKLPTGVSYADDLVLLMERGDAYECSFAFNVPDGGDDWSVMPDGQLLRTISQAILYEGSILVSPAAYPNTQANLRTLPAALRSKLAKGKRDENCGEDEQDADGNCPGDPDYDGDYEDRCACKCVECSRGEHDQCSDERCDEDGCTDCPAQSDTETLHLRLRLAQTRAAIDSHTTASN